MRAMARQGDEQAIVRASHAMDDVRHCACVVGLSSMPSSSLSPPSLSSISLVCLTLSLTRTHSLSRTLTHSHAHTVTHALLPVLQGVRIHIPEKREWMKHDFLEEGKYQCTCDCH